MPKPCPKHLQMGKARMKQDTETDEEGRQKRVNMESVGTK